MYAYLPRCPAGAAASAAPPGTARSPPAALAPAPTPQTPPHRLPRRHRLRCRHLPLNAAAAAVAAAAAGGGGSSAAGVLLPLPLPRDRLCCRSASRWGRTAGGRAAARASAAAPRTAAARTEHLHTGCKRSVNRSPASARSAGLEATAPGRARGASSESRRDRSMWRAPARMSALPKARHSPLFTRGWWPISKKRHPVCSPQKTHTFCQQAASRAAQPRAMQRCLCGSSCAMHPLMKCAVRLQHCTPSATGWPGPPRHWAPQPHDAIFDKPHSFIDRSPKSTHTFRQRAGVQGRRGLGPCSLNSAAAAARCMP